MQPIDTIKPISIPFLSDFIFTPSLLPFADKEILKMDLELSKYEQVYLNPDIEKNLISKNEFLTSFGISKAEESALTLNEAHDIQEILLNNPDYDFIGQKIKTHKRLTKKDHDKLEFFNVAKAFHELNQNPPTIQGLNCELIKNIHRSLTCGMDIFYDHLPRFTLYKSGKWRDNDLIRVGDYLPIQHKDIENSVRELVAWYRKDPSITNTAIFHTALYAIHPFNNGNKRVCRILEHLLLRQAGLNAKNLYSTSYYYHKEKPRYYKNLFYSLTRANFNHFAAFVLEAITLSMASVIKTSMESKRKGFLDNSEDLTTVAILKPLVKRRELQFKQLYNKKIQKKYARQTFVTYLGRAVTAGIVNKRESGRSTFYSLNTKIPEENLFNAWLEIIKAKLSYIPDDIKLA